MVDIDDFGIAQQPRLHFVLDREKAALHGVNHCGRRADYRHDARGERSLDAFITQTERDPLVIEFRMPKAARSDVSGLTAVKVRGADGSMVPLGRTGRGPHARWRSSRYFRKDLRQVEMVTAEHQGISPVNEVAMA